MPQDQSITRQDAPKVLVTKRLTLRPPLPFDADSVADALTNPNVARMLSKVPHPYSLSEAEKWVEAASKAPCTFTIHREQLIGVVAVNDGPEAPQLGYWLAEPWWGKGYMSEAARAVLAQAFRVFGSDIIGSYAIADNEASLRIMDKLGFVAVGKGTVFNHTRGAGYPTIKTELKLETFERKFGSLEGREAA